MSEPATAGPAAEAPGPGGEAPRPAGAAPAPVPAQPPGEIDGPRGPEPTRFGDWERGGRCTDF